MDCPNPKRSGAVAAAAACPCLPDDALVDVFSRLPVKCLHRSKCVCKRWRDTIADPLHGKVLPQTLVGFFNTTYPNDGALSWHGFVDPPGRFAAPPPLLDPSFPFLDELAAAAAGIECTLPKISDACNGLLLFEYGCCDPPESMGYVVFNPATAHRAVVPGIWNTAGTAAGRCFLTKAYLVFDPTASSHFHVLVFWEEEQGHVTVHAYSSETRAWSYSERDWSPEEQLRPTEAWRRLWYGGYNKGIFMSSGVVVNGALYVCMVMEGEHVILEVDVEGKTRSIIPVPSSSDEAVCGSEGGGDGEDGPCQRVLFFGHSRGRLHCISHGSTCCDLRIWVIEDHGTSATKQWVLKHTVSCVQLFGTDQSCRDEARTEEYAVFAIHPDCDTLFVLNPYTLKLISYDVDSDRARDLCTLFDDRHYVELIPYVPCFVDLLSN